MVHTFVVKAQAVDQRAMLFQSKNAWLGVAWLRPWCDGTDLQVTKTHSSQRVQIVAVFVQSSRQSNAVGEIQAEALDRGAGVIAIACADQGTNGSSIHDRQCQIVGFFRIHLEQDGASKPEQRVFGGLSVVWALICHGSGTGLSG